MRHISRILATLMMMDEVPTTSYGWAVNSREKSSWVGKSRTVQGAEIFAWISMMPPRAVKHSQGEAALCASDLIMIGLHRVNGAAAEFVILRVRSEDRT